MSVTEILRDRPHKKVRCSLGGREASSLTRRRAKSLRDSAVLGGKQISKNFSHEDHSLAGKYSICHIFNINRDFTVKYYCCTKINRTKLNIINSKCHYQNFLSLYKVGGVCQYRLPRAAEAPGAATGLKTVDYCNHAFAGEE